MMKLKKILLAFTPLGVAAFVGGGGTFSSFAELAAWSRDRPSQPAVAAKPDAGAIIAQTSVPILPDDTAYEVFGKVVVAAEQTLWNVLPAMLAGKTPKLPNDISKGSYFGGRKPEDGHIDWSQPAQVVYNLHRAVAPPYPGAWTVVNGKTFVIGKARLAPPKKLDLPQGLAVADNQIVGVCGDGHAILSHELLTDGKTVAPAELKKII